MISHKHKVIFIHISKCAGSSIETAFGIDVQDQSCDNHANWFGWDSENKMFLQHATPQQLFDANYFDEELWNSYYKFIIVRNPWDRSMSDYKWLCKHYRISDSFFNFLNARNKFKGILNSKTLSYRGDHLYAQKDYFTLNNRPIKYDKVIRFESIDGGLQELCSELKFSSNFFDQKVNVINSKKRHYSYYYNWFTKFLVENKYKEDIAKFNYLFEERKSVFQQISATLNYFTANLSLFDRRKRV